MLGNHKGCPYIEAISVGDPYRRSLFNSVSRLVGKDSTE